MLHFVLTRLKLATVANVSHLVDAKLSVIFVLSLPSNFERRHRIRNEIAKTENSSITFGFQFKLVFLLGRVKNQTDWWKVEEEAQFHDGMFTLESLIAAWSLISMWGGQVTQN